MTTGKASFPTKSARLVDGDVSGVPPTGIASLQVQNQFQMLRGKPVSTIQVLLCITDTGEEHGAMDRDGDLARLKRKASCCLSGKPVVLCRTGDLSSMNKQLRWEKGTIVLLLFES